MLRLVAVFLCHEAKRTHRNTQWTSSVHLLTQTVTKVIRVIFTHSVEMMSLYILAECALNVPVLDLDMRKKSTNLLRMCQQRNNLFLDHFVLK